MKKVLFFLSIAFFAQVSNAQKIDTVKAAILIEPVVTNPFLKDTACQLSWQANAVTRDTSMPVVFFVGLYNRSARRVYDTNVTVPASVIAEWGTDNSLIDDYILTKLSLKKKK